MACREAMQLKSAQFKIDQGYNDEKKIHLIYHLI